MATKYIRKSGSDANNGTNSTTDAVLTIARGIAVSTTNDTLDIGAGTWVENITMTNNRIYQGAGMFLTVINGTLSVASDLGTVLFNDLTILLNGNIGSYINKGVLGLTRVYFNGNGFGNPGSTYLTGNPDSTHTINFVSSIIFNVSGNMDRIKVMTNTVWNCPLATSSSFVAPPSGIVKNSFFGSTFSVGNVPTHTYNAYVSTPGGSWGLGTGEFVTTAAACFVDPTNGDFTLKSGSPLIAKGQA